MASRGRQSSAVWTLLSDSGIEYQPILAGVNRDLPFQMPAVVPRLRWRIRWLQLVDAVDFPKRQPAPTTRVCASPRVRLAALRHSHPRHVSVSNVCCPCSLFNIQILVVKMEMERTVARREMAAVLLPSSGLFLQFLRPISFFLLPPCQAWSLTV